MKTTPGPWYAKDGQIYSEETGKTLAVIPYFDQDDTEQQANAQLLGTAPEMLEALEIAHSYVRMFCNEHKTEQSKKHLQQITAILSKAMAD